jgi:hypothetical protein
VRDTRLTRTTRRMRMRQIRPTMSPTVRLLHRGTPDQYWSVRTPTCPWQVRLHAKGMCTRIIRRVLISMTAGIDRSPRWTSRCRLKDHRMRMSRNISLLSLLCPLNPSRCLARKPTIHSPEQVQSTVKSQRTKHKSPLLKCLHILQTPHRPLAPCSSDTTPPPVSHNHPPHSPSLPD